MTPLISPESRAADRFRVLFEHSSDPHFIFMDGGISDCNDATVRILGTSCRKDVLNLDPAVLSPERQPDGRLSSEKSVEMNALAVKNGVHRFEWVHRKLSGENFPVQVTLNSVVIDGKPAFIAVWHDLTEQKKREDELRAANEKMRRDLEAAAAVQKSMLPVSSPLVKGLRAAWSYRPCDELGGDILNVFPLDDRHVGLYVLDVTGHGLPASLLSVAASHFLSPYSESSFVRRAGGRDRLALAGPAEVAERLNGHFTSNPDLMQIFTLVYGILNTFDGKFTYVCAGHPSPAVISASGRARLAPGSGLPIGVAPEQAYDEMTLTLAPGDRLYLYSDGVTEAKNARRDQFGEDRFLGAVLGAASAPISEALGAVVKGVESWCRPGKPDDDVTLLACEWSL